ncbi:MAG TPA: aminodeoxychorismate synthase component I [Spirochaetota bacterium]|nr:aminodeoxychorismate synthase component I [Spirochaetota bacterium]HQF10449.1 aminodeoxychorismate synthase component I [Spirochaetota bacterium]HQH99430.1 aminodeoxychorismate synthase component I [Spirochaetota bacterium]
MIDVMNNYGKDGIPFIFIIDFLQRMPVILPVDLVDPADVLYDFRGYTNAGAAMVPADKIYLDKKPVDYASYRCAFDVVRERQLSGETYLANLTFPTPISINLTLKDIFFRSQAPYRLWCRDRFVVFSPEPFIRIDNGVISSFPMKGTIDASIPGARELLLDDEKEHAEHVTIVDLIRNDLNMVATNVAVKRFRYIETVETHAGSLLQASSHITGTLPDDYRERIGTIIGALLPAGSVTGAPKKKTVEIIRETETYDRGYYTGICGYCDGSRLDSGVMIRFIEKNGDKTIFKSGGGLTVYSDPEREYREMIDKVYVPIV